MKTILRKYNRLEDNNNHTDAAMLLVNQFGTDEEKEIMQGISDRHKKNPEIGITYADYQKRYEISNKYYKLLIKAS